MVAADDPVSGLASGPHEFGRAGDVSADAPVDEGGAVPSGEESDAAPPVDVGPGEDQLAEIVERAAAAIHGGDSVLAEEAGGTVHDPAQLRAERDEYLEALRRVKAEFENSKKRWDRERGDVVARAAAGLAEQLLPVLDACEVAVAQGAADVEPIAKALREVLEREGLQRIPDEGEPFDPTLHEAVMFEDGDSDEQVVAESLRAGYLWKGQVLRVSMVRVRG